MIFFLSRLLVLKKMIRAENCNKKKTFQLFLKMNLVKLFSRCIY